MVDLAGNPYLRDPRFALSPEDMRSYGLSSLGGALANLGAGIASAGATGQPWFAGIAPGAATATRGVEKNNARMAQMLGKIGTGGVPGFNVQPSPMQLGPQAPHPNNAGNVRPPGSSTGFQQPPDVDTGVALTVNDARAYPKAFNQPLNPDGSVNQNDIRGQTAVKRAQSGADELASMDNTPELKQQIDAMSAVDRANFKATLAKGDEKGVADAAATASISAGFRASPAAKFLGNDLGPAVRSTLGAPDATRRMQALRMSVGGNPEAVQGLQKAILDDFRSAAQSTVAEDSTGAPRLLANGAAKWLQSNKGAVANVLSPDQVAGLEVITRALKDQAQTAVKIAGPDTNRNLAAMSILEASLWKGAGDAAWLAPVRKALNPVYSGANDQAPERLTEVMLDPKVAAALMKKATPANVKMAEAVLTSIGRAATLPAEKERQ